MKAVQHLLPQLAREIHPCTTQCGEVFGETPADVPGSMDRLEHSERAGNGDPEAPGPTSPTTIVHDRRCPGFKRQRDRLSLPGAYRGRLRRHLAHAGCGRTPAFDPFEGGNATAGRSGTTFELPGNGLRDHDPMQLPQDVQVTYRIQIDERPGVEGGRLARFAAYLRQAPNPSA